MYCVNSVKISTSSNTQVSSGSREVQRNSCLVTRCVACLTVLITSNYLASSVILEFFNFSNILCEENSVMKVFECPMRSYTNNLYIVDNLRTVKKQTHGIMGILMDFD